MHRSFVKAIGVWKKSIIMKSSHLFALFRIRNRYNIWSGLKHYVYFIDRFIRVPYSVNYWHSQGQKTSIQLVVFMSFIFIGYVHIFYGNSLTVNNALAKYHACDVMCIRQLYQNFMDIFHRIYTTVYRKTYIW